MQEKKLTKLHFDYVRLEYKDGQIKFRIRKIRAKLVKLRWN